MAVYSSNTTIMNTRTGILFVFLILALAIQGFSQDSNTSKTEKKPQSDATQEETRSDGLRKITTRSSRNWNFDVRIDEKALEENIERAINQAMKSVEGTLERLEINI